MNADTVNLIERPYLEIVDDLITAMVGGIVNEPIIFDVKSDLYPLAQPAKEVRGITGTIDDVQKPDGAHYTFLKQVDFRFDPDKSAVVWEDGGRKPKDETTFYVDYFLTTNRSPLTDINVGSVTRTLSEAIGREIATLYQQINLAYLSGFIETAKGKALDFVVAILNVKRKTKEFAIGQATFFRDPDPKLDGNISIPEGTEVSTEKGEAVFETTEPRTLQRGQARIDVPIRAADKFKGEPGLVAAGKITAISQVITGIARVSNFDPTVLAAEDESDEDLRLRAKAAVRGLSKATILALMKAVFENRATLRELSDPNTTGKQTAPGKVSLVVDTEPGRFPALLASLNETRAAGVQLTVTASFVFVKPRVVAKITAGITADGKNKIVSQIIAALETYIDGLGAGNAASGKELLKSIKSVKDVKDATIVDVQTSQAAIGEPGTKALVEALVAKLSTVNPSDQDALRTAIDQTVNAAETAPSTTGGRKPNRGLVQSADAKRAGRQATDGEIETGNFLIVPPQKFSLILDMEPADIVLQES